MATLRHMEPAKKRTDKAFFQKETEMNLQVGLSSILLIFVILTLVSFAVLALTSATADEKLTNRVMERTSAYYEACNEAEQTLMDLDDTLSSIYTSSQSEEDYFAQAGSSKSFSEFVTDIQTLNVDVTILYPGAPDNPDGRTYRIESWKVVTGSDIVYDDYLLK